ncbi:MAG: RDD family protein [Betaproteobacteria bacterium]|nr:RDD family protein [Betaproteobacteria bacterium]
MTPPAPLVAPSLRRRMACFIYEGVLLFGVVMIAGWLFSTLTQQRNALTHRHELQAFLFLVLGIYFIWFWSHGGQTVAMKTWHIRLLSAEGLPLSEKASGMRYILSWVWFIPGLAIGWWSGLKGGELLLPLLGNVLLWALLAKLSLDGQFLHDRLAGTRLVDARPAR